MKANDYLYQTSGFYEAGYYFFDTKPIQYLQIVFVWVDDCFSHLYVA